LPTHDRSDARSRAHEPDGRAFVVLADRTLRRVLDTGTDLVAWYPAAARLQPVRRCACGRVCGSASSQTCGDKECIAALSRAAA
jgi:hypothetical protein